MAMQRNTLYAKENRRPKFLRTGESVDIPFLLLVLLLLVILVRGLVQRAERRKHAIFSNSKNKYKSRLGKKNIKY